MLSSNLKSNSNSSSHTHCLSSIVPAESKANSRAEVNGSSGALTIINSPKNGKRIEIPQRTLDELGQPATIEFGFLDGELVITAAHLSGNPMTVKSMKNKGVVYSASMVKEITETLGLDFSNGRVSRTLYKVVFEEENGNVYAFFSVGADDNETLGEDESDEGETQDQDSLADKETPEGESEPQGATEVLSEAEPDEDEIQSLGCLVDENENTVA